ncbi:MAG: hypothetical protein WA461_08110 [Nitrososphaeraceae archaeon]
MRGISVLDIGCGSGHAINTMAARFPIFPSLFSILGLKEVRALKDSLKLNIYYYT